MTRLKWFFAVITIAMLGNIAVAQTEGDSKPGFTLVISMVRRGGMPPNTHYVLVSQKNTSNRVNNEPSCMAYRGMYDFTVTYNGMPMEETDAVRHLKMTREVRNCGSGPRPQRLTRPGESMELELAVTDYYDMSRPGVYEITVTKETDPDHPDKSITVKSNTLTIVVPEPGVETPQ